MKTNFQTTKAINPIEIFKHFHAPGLVIYSFHDKKSHFIQRSIHGDIYLRICFTDAEINIDTSRWNYWLNWQPPCLHSRNVDTDDAGNHNTNMNHMNK